MPHLSFRRRRSDGQIFPVPVMRLQNRIDDIVNEKREMMKYLASEVFKSGSIPELVKFQGEIIASPVLSEEERRFLLDLIDRRWQELQPGFRA